MPKMAQRMIAKVARQARGRWRETDWWLGLAAVAAALLFWVHCSGRTARPAADRALAAEGGLADGQKQIAAYQATLRAYSEKYTPQEWALTQSNLGIAYCELRTGNRAANLHKAIACFEAALRVYTEKQFPADWARTQYNLGLAYRNLQTGDRAANLQNAVTCFEAALWIYTEQSFPQERSTTQTNLDLVLKDLSSLRASARQPADL